MLAKKGPPAGLTPLALRDALNQQLGATAVAAAVASRAGNITLTLMPGFTAQGFFERQQAWKEALGGLEVIRAEKPSVWVKLTAHGVPVEPFTGPKSLGVFTPQAETFNHIRV